MTHINERTHDQIVKFIEKHDIDTDNQFKQLVAEVGELSDALQRDDYEDIEEEIGDVAFVLRSIAILERVDIEGMANHVASENLMKDATKEGSKVTKDGLE